MRSAHLGVGIDMRTRAVDGEKTRPSWTMEARDYGRVDAGGRAGAMRSLPRAYQRRSNGSGAMATIASC